MDDPRLVPFLLWCALANYGLLMLAFVAATAMRGPMHRLHQHWFALTDVQIDAFLYLFLGLYKVAIWFVLLVPALVLWCLR